MIKTNKDYQELNYLVHVMSGGHYQTYVTIDGLKGFKFACPICSPNSKRKTGSIFPKRMEDWKGDYPKRWFYLCKGQSNCACKGLQPVDRFISTYFQTQEKNSVTALH